MLKLIFWIFASLVIMVMPQGDDMMGNGMWSLITLAECDTELDNSRVELDIKRHRINRTHDGISAKITSKINVDDSVGVLIVVCKFVDGGCKEYQIITDDSVVHLVNQYAKKNVKRAFEITGIDPPDFPIPEGHHEMENFIMDFCELPNRAVYGQFKAEAFLMDGDQKIGCVQVVIDFKKPDDEDVCN